MRTAHLALVTLAAAVAAPVSFAQQTATSSVQSLDADWRFHLGDDVSADDATKSAFDDASWQQLNVPHDWAIAGPFDKNAPAGRGGAFLPTGVGWYRKHFKLPADAAGKAVFVDFDGVMSHSTVYLNGVKLGERPFGYASFEYDLTPRPDGLYLDTEGKPKPSEEPKPQIKFGDAENVLAVRIDTSRQPASRWYAGSGIERHVCLVVTSPPFIEPGRAFVKADGVTAEKATLRINANIVVPGKNVDSHIKTRILDASGAEVATGGISMMTLGPYSLDEGGFAGTSTEIDLANPKLWSPDSPNLYTAVIEAQRNGKAVELERIPFGVREFHFDADTGFWLNGQNMKIKGVCLHADGGAVGMAVPKAVYRRRLERLKSLGVNAVRTSHHPFSPEFLDLCDEMGFLVMHEVFDCWNVGKNNAEKGYNVKFKEWWDRDLRDAILRDRNHPSIILYSAGNEIRDNLKAPEAFDLFKKMKGMYDKLDGTRPVTQAVFRPNQSGVYDTGYSELMDVVGQNYREAELVKAHQDKPTRKVLGTENGHDRRVWLTLRDNPFMSGQFLWTGIDYLGEADWPYTTWGDALLDRCGNVKPTGLQRQSWWSDQPMVAVVRTEAASGGASGRGAAELVDHWTPRDPDTYDEATAYVYSNCEEVELIANGESLGSKPMPKDAAPAEFKFPFDAGECIAVGKNGGKEVARQVLKTAGKAAAIKLTADRTTCSSDFDDVANVEVEVVDENGVRCPWADAEVEFAVEGQGKLVAVDNADPASHESFLSPKRQAYHGRALAIVRPTTNVGTMTLKATADGLAPASIEIRGPIK